MRNPAPIAALLLAFAGTFTPAHGQGSCVWDNYGSVPGNGCTASNVKFEGVVGFVAYDETAQDPCNCDCSDACPACTDVADPISCSQGEFAMPLGTVFGACLGNDDNIRVALTIDVEISQTQDDVGMYISLDGGNALAGECALSTIRPGSYTDGGNTITVGTSGNADACDTSPTNECPNTCPDIVSGTGFIRGYELDPIVFPCLDNIDENDPNAINAKDGLLDFSVVFVWGGTNNCDVSDGIFPIPGQASKCSINEFNNDGVNHPYTLKVHVPDMKSPSAQPSVSAMPSSLPSSMPSSIPSFHPSISTEPTEVPSSQPSSKPSSEPSSAPSGQPSSMPSSRPSEAPSISTEPSSMPSQAPSISTQPSSLPSESPSSVPSSAPSGRPSSQPSMNPSVSQWPTSQPSESPSISAQPSTSQAPSSQPSMNPSVSQWPTSQPSSMPSSQPSEMPSGEPSSQPSSQPSSLPSARPSSMPSSQPSEHPSGQPSSAPSLQPSISSQPSVSGAPSYSTDYPSLVPSISSAPSAQPSSQPSSTPSEAPSGQPSSQPSALPSSRPSESPSLLPSAAPSSQPSSRPSEMPSGQPSLQPSISAAPSISSAPSFTTEYPSLTPSISGAPSESPSDAPTISTQPSVSPTAFPSTAPSVAPTGAMYYPDWTSTEQVCKNDALEPEYIKELQRLNYLYLDKEECCEQHFWWRMEQCMYNERPMYFSNGSFCDIKTNFEDHESNSPTDWTSTTLFETLDECCRETFWWDLDGCLDGSPKKMTFQFSIDIQGLQQPSICQDADRIANALEIAATAGFGEDTNAFVESIGCVDLSRTLAYKDGSGGMVDGGLSDCRGCLAGETFIGDYDGTRTADYFNSSTSTNVQFEVHHMGSYCKDDACFQDLYNKMIADYTEFVASGQLAIEVITVALDSVPHVSELFNVDVDASSLAFGGLTTPWLPSEASGATGILVKTTGKFYFNDFDSSFLTTDAEITEVEEVFMNAIDEVLNANDLLPAGSVISITLPNLGNRRLAGDRWLSEVGSVEYKIEMHLDLGADVNSIVEQIEQELSDLEALESKIISSSLVSSWQAQAAVVSLAIYSYSPGTHTVSSILKWYPDWSSGDNACQNDGMHPTYMDDNPSDYLFDTQEECCSTWFSFGETCTDSTSSSSSEPMFYPDWSSQTQTCAVKSNFDPWEMDERHATLDECCAEHFWFNEEACCNTPGLGGCQGATANVVVPGSGQPSAVGDLKYLPDWGSETCYTKSSSSLATYEVAYSTDTARDCCNSFSSWEVDSCCERSGGC